MSTPRLALYASRWSAPPRWDLLEFVAASRGAGFAGVEMSLSDLGRDGAERRDSAALIDSSGLRLIVGVYSGWADYADGAYRGPPSYSPSDHMRAFESQLREVAPLGKVVCHINAHSGDDSWDGSTAADYLSDALALSARFLEENDHVGRFGRETDAMGGEPRHLIGISHETHRGRVLFHPANTRRLLEVLPPLRLTADVSHWHVVCERSFGSADCGSPEELEAMRLEIVPHIDHLHTRVGSVQRPQEEWRTLPEADRAVLVSPHEALWREVWTRKRDRGAAEVSATPEYGPPPYQARSVADESGENLWQQVIHATEHIRRCYDEWACNEEVQPTTLWC